MTLLPAATGPGAAAAPLSLRPTGGGVAGVDLALAGRLAEEVPGGRRTRTLRTTGYSMAGVTWTGSRPPARVALRWPAAGGWSRWRTLPLQTDLPAASEQGPTYGTQPVWTGRHRSVQVAVLGHRPRGLRLSLIDTGPTEPDAAAPVTATATPRAVSGGSAVAAADLRPTRAPKPALLSRRAWGADASWRNGRASYIRRIKQVHIHHTATANGYAAGDVPGLLRGMYYYHTHSLGWFDIAYNFLVDRFGRTWVGRSGGADRPVRGAHTLGFNHESVGIALIGRFGTRRPTVAAMKAVVDLAAWKLDLYGGHPRGVVRVRSHGSDRFPSGTWVTLPVIDGHRDTNETSCPGTRLYQLLPKLRRRVATRIHRYHP